MSAVLHDEQVPAHRKKWFSKKIPRSRRSLKLYENQECNFFSTKSQSLLSETWVFWPSWESGRGSHDSPPSRGSRPQGHQEDPDLGCFHWRIGHPSSDLTVKRPTWAVRKKELRRMMSPPNWGIFYRQISLVYFSIIGRISKIFWFENVWAYCNGT